MAVSRPSETFFPVSLIELVIQVGALRGYEHANGIALDLWESVYPDVLLLALTDTFSTEAFYRVSPRNDSSPHVHTLM